MAEVLSTPRRPDGQSFYSSSSPLKRSATSYSSFLSGSPTYTKSTPISSSYPTPTSVQHVESVAQSPPSPTAISPSSAYADLSSPPPSSISSQNSFSIGSSDDEQDDEIIFPSYNGVKFFHQDEPLDLPESPRHSEDEDDTPSQDQVPGSTTTESTTSDSPLPTPTVSDDTAVKQEPSRHVDYLSHDWREEDIWSSWRHIVSQRRVYGQRSRLENASWRTWAKNKYHLPTISPDSLNWLKDSDVTWLYGPLQPAISHPVTHSADPSPTHLTSSSSFVKKPILKKRSMSEVMLQRSLSASSLVKQAAAAVQAQQILPAQRPRPAFARAQSDHIPPYNSCDQISRADLDYFCPRRTSDSETSSESSGRHIRFDNKVEQCIAVDCKDHDLFDDSDDEDRVGSASDTDSDGEVVMLKRRRKKRPQHLRRDQSQNQATPGKIIEKLPDTTLKYKTDSPEVGEQVSSGFSRSWSSSKLSQSPSQETIRPSNPSKNFLLPHAEEDEEEEDEYTEAHAAVANRRDSVAVHRSRVQGKRPLEDDASPSGLRRTPSGMFMPYEEDDDDLVAAQLGLLGKVSDTINTAKDIAHVIWNVGWRK